MSNADACLSRSQLVDIVHSPYFIAFSYRLCGIKGYLDYILGVALIILAAACYLCAVEGDGQCRLRIYPACCGVYHHSRTDVGKARLRVGKFIGIVDGVYVNSVIGDSLFAADVFNLEYGGVIVYTAENSSFGDIGVEKSYYLVCVGFNGLCEDFLVLIVLCAVCGVSYLFYNAVEDVVYVHQNAVCAVIYLLGGFKVGKIIVGVCDSLPCSQRFCGAYRILARSVVFLFRIYLSLGGILSFESGIKL